MLDSSNFMKKTITYRLFELSRNRLIWLFCEWDAFIPQSLGGRFWGKPIYASLGKKIDKNRRNRVGANKIWIDLKWSVNANGGLEINYDVDIIKYVIGDLGFKELETDEVLSSVVGIDSNKLIQERGPHSNSRSPNDLVKQISSELEIDASNLGVIGSQVIGLEEKSESDFDVAINMRLHKMAKFQKDIWILKNKSRKLQKDFLGLHFPYKVFFKEIEGGKFGVDIFPKAIDLENHPLFQTKRWAKCGDKIEKEFQISDTKLGHEGWPTLVSSKGEMLVVLCNGFRGVFQEHDVISTKCFQTIVSSENRQIPVWVIQDPFRDIREAKTFFRFRKYRKVN